MIMKKLTDNQGIYYDFQLQIVGETETSFIAELTADALFWQALAAIAWLLALGPWVLGLNRIYLAPRVDGKPG